jgi:hypothetical protein
LKICRLANLPYIHTYMHAFWRVIALASQLATALSTLWRYRGLLLRTYIRLCNDCCSCPVVFYDDDKVFVMFYFRAFF